MKYMSTMRGSRGKGIALNIKWREKHRLSTIQAMSSSAASLFENFIEIPPLTRENCAWAKYKYAS